jgi:sarcosine oxidase subunit gamma
MGFELSSPQGVSLELPMQCEGLAIEAAAPRVVVNLRGNSADPGFVSSMRRTLNIDLPLVANRWHATSSIAAIWLGPDEWLVVGEKGDAASLEKQILAARPDDPWLSAVDLSHAYSVLRVSGARMLELLAKGCPLDLHPAAFGPGNCAQTNLAKARVLLLALGEGAAIECWFRNSFSAYAVHWLLDASAEFR